MGSTHNLHSYHSHWYFILHSLCAVFKFSSLFRSVTIETSAESTLGVHHLLKAETEFREGKNKQTNKDTSISYSWDQSRSVWSAEKQRERERKDKCRGGGWRLCNSRGFGKIYRGSSPSEGEFERFSLLAWVCVRCSSTCLRHI